MYRFHAGGLYPVDRSLLQSNIVPIQNDATLVVINDILQYLKKSEKHCCLFEEPNAKPSDPWVKKKKIDYVHLGEEMFYFFSNNVNSEAFEDAFKTSVGYYFLCTLSSQSVEIQKGFCPLSSLTAEQLNDYASNIDSLFVSAYDFEGYLQWNKEA